MIYELNKIYNVDCNDAMPTFKDNYFDLAIVDPPYEIKQNGHRLNNRSKLAKSKKYHDALWFQKAPDESYFNELKRISKNQIIFGGNYYPQYLSKSPCWIVWDKDNGTSNFADCELAYTSFNTAVRKVKCRWNGMIQHNMSQKEIRIHPTQKPVSLYKWILNNYASPGNKIIDTHVGSASSIIACLELGFPFVAFEIEKIHFNDAIKRVSEYQPEITTNL